MLKTLIFICSISLKWWTYELFILIHYFPNHCFDHYSIFVWWLNLNLGNILQGYSCCVRIRTLRVSCKPSLWKTACTAREVKYTLSKKCRSTPTRLQVCLDNNRVLVICSRPCAGSSVHLHRTYFVLPLKVSRPKKKPNYFSRTSGRPRQKLQ